MSTKVYFENIQFQILKEIQNAKQSIYVAVAWFTDKEIYQLLCKKAKEGVRVFVIILNDEINVSEFGLDFSILRSSGGDILLIDGKTEMMHNKFCIIDKKNVINGSYNWTKKAKNNDENITISKDLEDLSASFISEFYRLINKKVIYSLASEYKDLIPYRIKNKWGFCTPERKIVINCIYDNFITRNVLSKKSKCSFFSNGLMGVKKNEKWGLINLDGDTIMSFKYDDISRFSDSMVGVKKENKWGFVDIIGDEVLPFIYDYVNPFSEETLNQSKVMINGYSFYIDKKMNTLSDFTKGYPFRMQWENQNEYIYNTIIDILPEFGSCSYSEGMKIFEKDKKFGFKDESGEEIIPAIYDNVQSFINGIAEVSVCGGWGFIDKKGNKFWED